MGSVVRLFTVTRAPTMGSRVTASVTMPLTKDRTGTRRNTTNFNSPGPNRTVWESVAWSSAVALRL
ncbi:hypothetical protein D3C71_1975070 [compost metagenome]